MMDPDECQNFVPRAPATQCPDCFFLLALIRRHLSLAWHRRRPSPTLAQSPPTVTCRPGPPVTIARPPLDTGLRPEPGAARSCAPLLVPARGPELAHRREPSLS
jgi:hypothetical protein